MRWRHGGQIVWRWSYVGWWPHYFWSPDGKRLLEYVPYEYEYGRILPPFLFKGYVQEMLTEEISKRSIVNGKKRHLLFDIGKKIREKL